MLATTKTPKSKAPDALSIGRAEGGGTKNDTNPLPATIPNPEVIETKELIRLGRKLAQNLRSGNGPHD
jgi:hypothetical protein